MNNLIDLIIKTQKKYLSYKEKKYLKSNSQFFTPVDTAYKMISTIDFNRFSDKESLNILEPSAGCGILIATLLECIIKKCKNIKKIYICAFELNKELSNILIENLHTIKKDFEENHNIIISFNVTNGNFITENRENWLNKKAAYDIIISNPPYKKINKTSEEGIIMSDIVYGQPNLYTLFIAMSLSMLNFNGTYTVLSPRNYLNGIYTSKIRDYIFNDFQINHIHSFEKRNMFKSVNQEVIITTFSRKNDINKVQISYNGHKGFSTNVQDLILKKNNSILVIPKTKSEIKLLKAFKKLNFSLKDLNLKINVGPVVQFRNTESIRRDIQKTGYAPLLIGKDIQPENIIQYYSRENNLNRDTHNKSISLNNRYLIKNSNYLLIRKVVAKDDTDVVVSSVLHKSYFKCDLLGIDNNLLYINSLDKELTLEECYGLYCFINSKQFKDFYFLINGTHTINVSDFENIKFPKLDIIKLMGNELILDKDYSEQNCSNLVEKNVGINQINN
ncbi:Eco57I restriction-modification methylase domain-containing protein [Metaclostridioides mangenotii]|uniref:site-specific DNA-methyltransferase (adenine-specific) n=1 Tax=Metaclostridioides mangenotii TaxID=1540 RepID=A0ABS4E6V4_9FIRM|nr:Eco57I restriction-modification methylase domain-containing protein [Clostridioides mangenotii]MBP1853681.1 adenine-specific DNA-methyltransferase [Clostridioides mangenotii]